MGKLVLAIKDLHVIQGNQLAGEDADCSSARARPDDNQGTHLKQEAERGMVGNVCQSTD